MIHWHAERESFERFVQRLTRLREVVEPSIDTRTTWPGYCVACRQLVTFTLPRTADGGWRDLRESFLCQCGLNGRMRMVFWACDELLSRERHQDVLVFEQLTPFFRLMSERYPFSRGCEYLGPDIAPGTMVATGARHVRHEDMLNLSPKDATLDLIVHCDVLEHVPDHVSALAECWRVLKPGGVLLFTCPFFGLEKHVMRARIDNGRLAHIHEPIYHGNPLSDGRSLVYTEHGWPLLQDLLDVGFASVEIGVLYDPFQGIVSNNNPYPIGFMWPLMFRAKK
jgi:SAM-dependent methyltransferase